ncbi:MAG: hypothetical protein U1E26_11900 [Coriobacteriia bacterium]|nr:hypothetical protein [Coriobacteriia bacterium]
MIRQRPTLPAGHGELLTTPVYDEWAALVAANRSAAESWDFEIGGVDARELRAAARCDMLSSAAQFSARLGVPVRPAGLSDAPIIATGHQPELYHPGVWAKDFLVQRFADETGATAVDVVVDTDGFDAIRVTSPCMDPGLARCRQYLALATPGACYASTPVPCASALADFRRATSSALESLPAPSVPRHFERFADCIESAAHDAENLAELVTFARRRYEAAAQTDYLEVPVTQLAAGEAYARFVVHLLHDSRRFAGDHNAELAAYRAATQTRSAAQPFPDLEIGKERVEVPFWWLAGGTRKRLYVREVPGGVALVTDDGPVLELPADVHVATAVLSEAGRAGMLVAPKALTLTAFVRMLCCDLFVHGVGGGRYDRVTDSVIRRYFGVEPPAYAVASITLYLPLGAHLVSDAEIAQATERVNRFEHNPDALLASVDFDDPDEQAQAAALVKEKARLVADIAAPDADKKRLGMRIREVNAELAGVLAPLKAELLDDLERLKAQRAAADILTDRTYPFCFWDPEEVADKVR